MGPSATTAVRTIELKFIIRDGPLLSSGTKTLLTIREAPHAFDTPDGSWRQKWLYELNSLDPENLRKRTFKHDEDITYDEIACFQSF